MRATAFLRGHDPIVEVRRAECNSGPQDTTMARWSSGLSDSHSFVFTTCQIGAEPALKDEVSRAWPLLRFAFSRPGFLTFKVAPGKKLPEDFASSLVFARAAGFCLGKVWG